MELFPDSLSVGKGLNGFTDKDAYQLKPFQKGYKKIHLLKTTMLVLHLVYYLNIRCLKQTIGVVCMIAECV